MRLNASTVQDMAGGAPFLYIQWHVGHPGTCRVGQSHVYLYGIFGREIFEFTVMYGAYIKFWSTLDMWHAEKEQLLRWSGGEAGKSLLFKATSYHTFAVCTHRCVACVVRSKSLWVQCETPELRFMKCSIKWDVLTFCFSPVSASLLHSFYSLDNTTSNSDRALCISRCKRNRTAVTVIRWWGWQIAVAYGFYLQDICGIHSRACGVRSKSSQHGSQVVRLADLLKQPGLRGQAEQLLSSRSEIRRCAQNVWD